MKEPKLPKEEPKPKDDPFAPGVRAHPIRLPPYLPTHCPDCGVLLMGGATQHREDCQILAIIRSHFPNWPRDEREQARGPHTSPSNEGEK